LLTATTDTARRGGHAFLDGGGELGALMRAFDWSSTSLGAIAHWPQSLRTTVGLLLRSPIPIVLLWGEDGIMIYNDAYSGFAAGRHPRLLGSRVREGWPEVAAFNDKVMKVGLAGGTLSYKDQELTLYRRGVPEQVWMDLDYSPVLDEAGRPAGVLAIVVETTERVQAERRVAREGERLRNLFKQAPGFMHVLQGPDHVIELVNDAYLKLVGHRGDLAGKTVREAFPEMQGQGYFELLDTVFRSGEPFVGHAMSLKLRRKLGSPIEERFVDLVYQPIMDDTGAVTGIFAEGSDVTKRVRAEQHQRLLIDELNHRVKNTLATVQSIAAQTFRADEDPSGRTHRAREVFESRLVALSRAHDVLTRENWDGAGLHAIVREATLAYRAARHDPFVIDGPPIRLSPKLALALAMVLHELSTNAAKYGALSVPMGTVSIRWAECVLEGSKGLRVEWRERGGPPVSPPSQRGFGSRLIERQMKREFGGDVRLDFEPDGVVCTMLVALPDSPELPGQAGPDSSERGVSW
jgi:PAS domain S-box-containing protein